MSYRESAIWKAERYGRLMGGRNYFGRGTPDKIGVFMSVDKMVGKEFENGLASLTAIAEKLAT